MDKKKSFLKFRLVAECFFIFVALPVVLYFDFWKIPKIPVLLIAFSAAFLALWKDFAFEKKNLYHFNLESGYLKNILIRWLLLSAVLAIMVWQEKPDSMFYLPENRPRLYVFIMLMYPFVSALPQELIYRTFFFHRYKPLFGNGILRIAASSLLFSFLHIIYDNWVAIVLTAFGGVMFSITYNKTRSLPMVVIEHGLWGDLIFTLGLGNYFYEGF